MIGETPDIVNTGPGAPNNFGGTCERLKPKPKPPGNGDAADSLGVKVEKAGGHHKAAAADQALFLCRNGQPAAGRLAH